MSLRKLGAWSCALLLMASAASAADGTPSGTFREDILRLLDVTGAKTVGLQMGAAMAGQVLEIVRKARPDVSERAAEIIRDETARILDEKVDELFEDLVPIYGRYLTQEDVRALVAFFETPLGRKYVAALPGMMNEGLQAGQVWGQRLGPEFGRRMKARLEVEAILE